MKCSALVNLAVISVVLASGVIGCKKNPKGTTPIPGARVGESKPEGPIDGRSLPQAETPATSQFDPTKSTPLGPGHPGWIEDRDTFKAQTIYFDLDKSVVKSSEMPKVEAVAARLKAEGGKAVKVEGHCDERGTEEYNRALGERRALAVREALITLGIAADRVDTISFGEDKPAVPGHDEAAWAKNRRGEFILLSPP
jgi:peptidoglycan-associated lipoprotein